MDVNYVTRLLGKKVYIIILNSLPKFSETFIKYHLDNFPHEYILIVGRNHKELISDVPIGFFKFHLSRLVQHVLKFKYIEKAYIISQIFVRYNPIGILAEYGHLGEYGVPLSEFFKCKLVTVFRGYDVYTHHNGIIHNKAKYRKIISHYSNIIATSDEIKGELEIIGVKNNRIITIPSGVDEYYLALNQDINKNFRIEKQILFVGRLIKDKGIYEVIEAFSRLIEMDREYKLVIVGDGDEMNQIKSLIDIKGLDKQIQIKGSLDKVKLKELYLQSKYLWFMSKPGQNGWKEGSPNVVLEALAMGLIVIATDIGGVRGYEKFGMYLEIVPINEITIDSFVSITIRYQYASGQDLDKIRTNNKLLISSKFTRRNNLDEIIRLLS